jgi:hypothetical protein
MHAQPSARHERVMSAGLPATSARDSMQSRLAKAAPILVQLGQIETFPQRLQTRQVMTQKSGDKFQTFVPPRNELGDSEVMHFQVWVAFSKKRQRTRSRGLAHSKTCGPT